MTATRLWMFGCVGFAGLSTYLAISLLGNGLNQYSGDLHYRFVSSQRDTFFKLIPEIRPRLRADQIVAAAGSANIEIVRRTSNSIELPSGVEFSVQGTEINGIRSTNF